VCGGRCRWCRADLHLNAPVTTRRGEYALSRGRRHPLPTRMRLSAREGCRGPGRVVDPGTSPLRVLSELLAGQRWRAGFTSRFRRAGVNPAVDDGFVGVLKRGRARVVGEVERLSREGALLVGGDELKVDAVICVTGYRRGLEPLVGDLGVLDVQGVPRFRDGPLRSRRPGPVLRRIPRCAKRVDTALRQTGASRRQSHRRHSRSRVTSDAAGKAHITTSAGLAGKSHLESQCWPAIAGSSSRRRSRS
jgi:hypothetical protein